MQLIRRLARRCRRYEKAAVRLDPFEPSADLLRRCFAEIFRSLDARPRRLVVSVGVANEERLPASVTLREGKIVFRVGEQEAVGDFRRRWLACHPVPLVFPPSRAMRLFLVPTTGNRVKVMIF
jgi:hypothetical protein